MLGALCFWSCCNGVHIVNIWSSSSVTLHDFLDDFLLKFLLGLRHFNAQFTPLATQDKTVLFTISGVQRRCVWAVGGLGAAACLACVAAVDRQARQSCLVWCGGVKLPPDKCVLRRSASGGRTAPPDTLRHRPDTERTCVTVGRLHSHRHTRHDKTVLSVSCLVWRCELAVSGIV